MNSLIKYYENKISHLERDLIDIVYQNFPAEDTLQNMYYTNKLLQLCINKARKIRGDIYKGKYIGEKFYYTGNEYDFSHGAYKVIKKKRYLDQYICRNKKEEIIITRECLIDLLSRYKLWELP